MRRRRCLLYFPAESQLENYLHIFIRERAPADLKKVLKDQAYAISYADVLAAEPPTLEELEAKYAAAVESAAHASRRSFSRRDSFNR